MDYAELKKKEAKNRSKNGHHHHHVHEGLGLLSCSLILKVKLVPPSLPRSSYVPLSFWSKNGKSTNIKVLVLPQLVLLQISNLISCTYFIKYEMF
jgi:hypothetical protein